MFRGRNVPKRREIINFQSCLHKTINNTKIQYPYVWERSQPEFLHCLLPSHSIPLRPTVHISTAHLTSSNSRLTVITSPSEHASARVGTMELVVPRPFRVSLPEDDDDDDADEETEESLPFPAPRSRWKTKSAYSRRHIWSEKQNASSTKPLQVAMEIY